MQLKTKESRLEEFSSNPNRALWTLALPMMAGMSVQAIYQIVDMIFVGKLGPNAIAALAFNLPLLFFAIGIIFGLGSGVTAIIAQYIGMKNKKKADNAAEHSILLGLFISTIFTIIGWTYGKKLLLLLGTPTNILSDAYNYFIILVTGICFMILSVFFRSILSGEGDTKFPMYVMGLGTIINIILDPILIFGFNLGVGGAAAATIISQAIVCLIFLYAFIIKKYPYISFEPKHFKFNLSILYSILTLGLPASFSMVLMSFGSAIFNKILVGFSPDIVSAYQIASRVDHLFFMPVISIVSSMVTLVGMFYGAKKMLLVKYIIHYGLKQTILISFGVGLFFYFGALYIFPIFTDSKNIIHYGIEYIKIAIFSYPFIAIGMTSSRIMQGLGYGMPMFFLTLLRVILISVPLSIYFIYFQNQSYIYIWYAMVISSFITAIIAYPWMRINLKKRSQEIEINTILNDNEV
tara:strand:+ start:560 stop:1951 length:1392 start_codon:yes stop_codon:yes gene_type:complete